jgi:hypothetical protein
MNIRWLKLRHDSHKKAELFMRSMEHLCVPACERFINWDEGPDRIWEAHERKGDIQSLLVLSATGILYPILKDPLTEGNQEGISRCLSIRRIRSIQGELASVVLCEKILTLRGQTRADYVDYSLMRMDTSPEPEAFKVGPENL